MTPNIEHVLLALRDLPLERQSQLTEQLVAQAVPTIQWDEREG